MKTLQIEANKLLGDSVSNNEILRTAGVKRIHAGWYTVKYNGVQLDRSTVVSAKRNRTGRIKSNEIRYEDRSIDRVGWDGFVQVCIEAFLISIILAALVALYFWLP